MVMVVLYNITEPWVPFHWMIELVTFVALLSLMMYAVCLIVLLVAHVEAGGQIKG